MEYQVKVRGEVVSAYTDKQDAISHASAVDRHDDPQVIAHEVSGTYESHTCVWPTRGETYSN